MDDNPKPQDSAGKQASSKFMELLYDYIKQTFMYKLVTDELKGKVSSRQLLRSENTAKKIRSNGATNRSREKIRSFIHLPMSPAITAKKSVHNYSKKGGSKLNQEVSL